MVIIVHFYEGFIITHYFPPRQTINAEYPRSFLETTGDQLWERIGDTAGLTNHFVRQSLAEYYAR